MLGPLAKDAPHLIAAALAAGAVAGLLAVERKGALQLMLARPLVLAPLLGLVLGDVEAGFMLGVPLELLTLGGVSLGAALPDNESILAGAVTCAVVPVSAFLGHTADEATCALALFALAPLGLLGRKLERGAEERNVALADRALELAQAGDARGVRLNLLGVVRPFFIAGSISFACVLLAPLLAEARKACPERLLAGLSMGWHLVWALSAAAAIRAIRDARAPALSALAAAAVAGAAVILKVLG